MVFEETGKYKGVPADVLAGAYREARATKAVQDGGLKKKPEKFKIEIRPGSGVFRPLQTETDFQLFKTVPTRDVV